MFRSQLKLLVLIALLFGVTNVFASSSTAPSWGRVHLTSTRLPGVFLAPPTKTRKAGGDFVAAWRTREMTLYHLPDGRVVIQPRPLAPGERDVDAMWARRIAFHNFGVPFKD